MMLLNRLEFLVGQTVLAIRHNPLMTFAAITNVAVALCVIGGFSLAVLNLQNMAAREARAAIITVELAKDAKAADVEQALLSDVRIKTTRFVTKDKALEELATRNRMDLASLKLLPNPLPDSYIVHLNDPQQIAQVTEAAKKIKGVSLARYPQQVTSKLLLVARGVKLAGFIVALMLIVAGLTVISTTIRLTIFARRREIRIMQLVGATDWFIRLPFLLEGIFNGIIGGVIAAGAVLAVYISLHDYVTVNLEFIQLMYSGAFITISAVAIVFCGGLFGAVGSLMGLRRYLLEV